MSAQAALNMVKLAVPGDSAGQQIEGTHTFCIIVLFVFSSPNVFRQDFLVTRQLSDIAFLLPPPA